MGSLHYIVERERTNGLRQNHSLITIYVHAVHAFTFTALERSIATGLFMDEIFHLNKVC